jgi:hypothetical protein
MEAFVELDPAPPAVGDFFEIFVSGELRTFRVKAHERRRPRSVDVVTTDLHVFRWREGLGFPL